MLSTVSYTPLKHKFRTRMFEILVGLGTKMLYFSFEHMDCTLQLESLWWVLLRTPKASSSMTLPALVFSECLLSGMLVALHFALTMPEGQRATPNF